MARCTAAVGGNTKEFDIKRRRKQFDETRAEVANEINKLIDKIGFVNTLALLHALNDAEIVDVDSNCTDDFASYGWFTLNTEVGYAINVDDELKWQERCCVIEQIHFGLDYGLE